MKEIGCKGTIKWEKNQIYLSFSEREYLRVWLNGTIKWEKNQIYLSFSEREYHYCFSCGAEWDVETGKTRLQEKKREFFLVV